MKVEELPTLRSALRSALEAAVDGVIVKLAETAEPPTPPPPKQFPSLRLRQDGPLGCPELVDHLKAEYGLSDGEAHRRLHEVLGGVRHLLEAHGTVPGWRLKISGFGVFSVVQRPARTRNSPKTGRVAAEAPRTALKFRLTSKLAKLGKPEPPPPPLRPRRKTK